MKTEIAAFMKIMGPELPFVLFESEKQEATVKLEDLRKYIDDSRALARTEAIEEAVQVVEGMKDILWHDDIPEHTRRIHRHNTIDEVVTALQGLKGV